MKKILILFVVLAVSFSASAQFKGGIYAGINGTQVDGDGYSGYYKLGLNVAGAAFFPLSKRFDLGTEISYTQKGSQAKSVEGYPIQMRFRVNYLEVPVLFYLRDKDNKNPYIGKLSLIAGLSFARLISNSEILADTGNFANVPGNPYFKPSGPLRNFDYDVVLGLGYNLTEHWQFNFRFSYSMIQFGASTISRQINYGMFNNVLTFRMGYILGGNSNDKIKAQKEEIPPQ